MQPIHAQDIWRSVKGIFLFIVITLCIHFLWKLWALNDYHPFHSLVDFLFAKLSALAFNQSSVVLKILFPEQLTAESQIFSFAGGDYIIINSGCSGLKQMVQYFLLLLIYPGSCLKKIWYIPLGILIIHITNLIRIVGLGLVLVYFPQYWDFSHDYLFRPLFYLVIFCLWLYWEEKQKAPQKNIKKTEAIEA